MHGYGLHTLIQPLLAALLLLQQTAWAAEQVRLPDFGNSADRMLTTRQLDDIAQLYLRELRKNDLLLEDPLVEEYIQNLGFRLVSHSSAPGMGFQFHVLKSPVVNAFATPGGFIVAFSGLIDMADNEAELASVLAHEIAHVTQDHLLRSTERTIKANLPVMLGMLAVIIAGASGSGGSTNASMAAVVAGQGLLQQNQINFTRDNEYEADRIGIQTLKEAGFDPAGMAAFFGKMQRLERNYGQEVPELLRTHPLSVNRIAEAKARAQQLTDGEPIRDSRSFHLAQERIRVLSHENPAKAYQEFLARSRKPGLSEMEREALQYGLALLETRTNQGQAALDRLHPLLQQAPTDRWFLLARAEALHRAGRHEQARNAYESLLRTSPDDLAVLLPYTGMLLERKQTDDWRKARQLLRAALADFPDRPDLHTLLARTEHRLGNTVNATLADAHARFLNGDIYQAVQTLKALKRNEQLNYYQRSKLEARLKQYREANPELMKKQARKDRH